MPELFDRRVAIVGSGPSGLFAAQALTRIPGIAVDIYDRLPTPFGLLRYGVAPDHTSIKAISERLEGVFDSPAIRFLGLVEFGRDVSRAELLDAYDAVIYAAGASEDRRMAVPGEDLPGSRSAREFVAWYSGHPDATPQLLEGVQDVVTVGVGNVAVDVARILLRDRAELAATDMPEAVLAELRGADIRNVWVVGRRGPQHASFTTVELRELLSDPTVAVTVSDGALDVDEAALDRRTAANIDVLKEAAARVVPNPRAHLGFLFWQRPVGVVGENRVSGVHLERTTLDSSGRVVPAQDAGVLPADLVLRAIGYRGKPLPGVPFDPTAGVIPNIEGRVTDGFGAVQAREYVVGWIKRGPLGVIGTNKSDAAETVRHLLADLAAVPVLSGRLDIDAVLESRGINHSSYADWQRIDDAEVARGGTRGRSRTKIEAWHELIDLVAHERPGGPASVADGGLTPLEQREPTIEAPL